MKSCWLVIAVLLSYSVIFSQSEECAYVSREKGAPVMTLPSDSSEVITNLEYGRSVKIIGVADSTKTGVANQQFSGKWLHIYFNMRNCSCKASGESCNQGYILSSFVSSHLTKVPERTLYNYYTKVIGQHEHEVYDHEDGWEFKKRYGCCYPYYERNLNHTSTESTTEWKRSKKNNPGIQNYFSLELVEDTNFDTVLNKYTIDTTAVHKVVSQRNHLPKSLHKFYLNLNSSDSVLISDYDGEYLLRTSYVGQTHSLNKFLINRQFEGPSHSFIDKQTGKEDAFTNGVPYISPDGEYVIDFFQPMDLDLSRGDYVILSHLQDSSRTERIISVEFKSWVASKEVNSAFWISNRELIIKIMPIDNLSHRTENGLPEEKRNYQYLKLTIKE